MKPGNWEWFATATIGFAAGSLFMFALDVTIPHIRFGEEEIPHQEKGEAVEQIHPHHMGRHRFGQLRDNQSIDKVLFKSGILIAIGITIHNIPEGIAVGAGYMHAPAFGIFIALAILTAQHSRRHSNCATIMYERRLQVGLLPSSLAFWAGGTGWGADGGVISDLIPKFYPHLSGFRRWCDGFHHSRRTYPRCTGTWTPSFHGIGNYYRCDFCVPAIRIFWRLKILICTNGWILEMDILDQLLNELNIDAPIRSILVGAHWTVVCSRHCGMAATLMDNHSHGRTQVRDVGRLHTKRARAGRIRPVG